MFPQQADGHWGSTNELATTCFALSKLQDYAYELDFASPFEVAYEYSDEVIAGWQYVFDASRTVKQTPLAVQDHTAGASGTMDDPDTNGNGYGVWFEGGFPDVYTTGACLIALNSSGTPDRANDGGLDFDGDQSPDTFLQIAQEAVDWLAWAQGDSGVAEGSWDYTAMDNASTRLDGSAGGFASLGLGLAAAFGAVVPNWVLTELEQAIDTAQCDTVGPDFGGKSYSSSNCDWVNEYKTGHLIYQMGLARIALNDQDFIAATDFIDERWRNANNDPGWGYNQGVANYLAMWSLMKGLSANGIDLIDTDGDGQADDDWYNQEPPASPAQDFASVIVAQQNQDGSWPLCSWGNQELCTTWALLTLERKIPILPDRERVEVGVPTMSQWALVSMILLLGGIGYWRLRRRA